jgi:hypothetical protein
VEKTKETNAMCDVMILLCTTKYDVKHLQANKNTKKLFKRFMFVSKTIYNKPCTTNQNKKQFKK